MPRILVVEDKESMLKMLRQLLEEAGHEVETATSAEQAMDKLETGSFPVVITDLKLPKKSGLDVLSSAKKRNPHTQVILLSAYGTVETAVEAMKHGAFDFLSKPFDNEHLLLLVQRAMEFSVLQQENIALRQSFKESARVPELVGQAPVFLKAIELAKKVAPSDTTVLLTGESGTGKELFAKLIHSLGPTAEGPFVAVSCASLSEGVLESELFGHEKGSFTGATNRRQGRFELAKGGTLFLDEIGDVNPNVQVKLLRVIQEKKFERVGGTETITAQFRLIAATNHDLLASSRDKKFREDLYYRLSVFPIHLPLLRNRQEDIPLLAEHFLKLFRSHSPKKISGFSKDAQALLQKYPWPGNVRELQNVIERAMILCPGTTLTSADFSFLESQPASPARLKDLGKNAKLEAEKSKILDVLREVGGNKSKAAKKLGISYKTLLSRLKP